MKQRNHRTQEKGEERVRGYGEIIGEMGRMSKEETMGGSERYGGEKDGKNGEGR